MTITDDGQLDYRGFVLGSDDTFMTELTGWDDLPPVDSGNTPRSMYHGSYAGRKFGRERVITWTGTFSPKNLTEWSTSLAALRAAFTITDAEYPITISTLDEVLVAYGSVTARAIPNNRRFGAVKAADVSIQFTCSDPRKYSLSQQTVSISFPTVASSGLVYPLVYPLDYGASTSSGTASFVNSGDAPLPAVYRINGPVDNPVIYLDSSDVFIGMSISLLVDEYIDIDTSTGTVVLNGTTDRLYTRTPDSSPISSMELSSGNNEIRISAASWGSGASVTVTAASAAYF